MARVPDSLLIFSFLLMLLSCDPNRVYDTNSDLASKYWHKDSVMSFSFSIPDAKKNYNVFMNLRNTSTYLFQNIYVQYELQDSTRKILETSLESFQLFHPQTGEPFGASGVGDIYDHQFSILENYRFPFEGKYRISFEQMMRRDTLTNILSVGTRVEVYQAEN